jgi:hypothetical protein
MIENFGESQGVVSLQFIPGDNMHNSRSVGKIFGKFGGRGDFHVEKRFQVQGEKILWRREGLPGIRLETKNKAWRRDETCGENENRESPSPSLSPDIHAMH